MKTSKINLKCLNNENPIDKSLPQKTIDRFLEKHGSVFSMIPVKAESTICHFVSDNNVVTHIYLSRYVSQDIAQPLPPDPEAGGQLGRGH